MNSVMASSSSVSVQKFLFNQSTILLEMKCPNKQARGESGKEPKHIGDRTEEKNLGRNQAQSGGHFSSGQTTQQFNSNCCKSIVRAQLVPEVLS